MKKEVIAVHHGQLGALRIMVKEPGLSGVRLALCHPSEPHSHPERRGSIFTEKNSPKTQKVELTHSQNWNPELSSSTKDKLCPDMRCCCALLTELTGRVF